MRAPDRSTQPHFSQPLRQIALMVVVLALVVVGAWLAYAQIYPIFHINPLLNGTIGAVFLFGVLACFWQVWQLISAVVWIESYAANRQGRPQYRAPLLLAPLATLLGARGASRKIATTASRSILESVATRIDEARDITRYLTSLLIFLGLLGTFYGLAITVPGVVDTIRALAPQPGEGADTVFQRLMTGLESQLGGMGTAFSSSLIGLAGSLVLGLLELFVSHGQNRFYRELEEWISSITRLSFAAGEGSDGEGSIATEILDQMAEQMDGLHAMFAQGREDRAQTEARLDAVAGALNRLAQETASERDERQAQTMALRQIASGQSRLTEALERLSDQMGASQDSDSDAEIRARLRSIDMHLPRLLEEISAGRQENAAEVRNGLAALTRSLMSAKES